jgi:hypothetical protein
VISSKPLWSKILKSADFVMPQENPKRTLPFVVVCEGYSDVCFVAELLEHLHIETCNVGCPTKKNYGDGKDAIPAYLKGLSLDKKGLRGVLVVVDGDQTPEKFFTDMSSAMDHATFPRPSQPFAIEDRNNFKVGVFLTPRAGEKGTLDGLLLEAVYEKHPDARVCVERFVDCTKVSKAWTPNYQSKMKLSALVAAYCEGNPWSSLAWVWSQKGNPIPINSARFAALSDTLRMFAQ